MRILGREGLRHITSDARTGESITQQTHSVRRSQDAAPPVASFGTDSATFVLHQHHVLHQSSDS